MVYNKRVRIKGFLQGGEPMNKCFGFVLALAVFVNSFVTPCFSADMVASCEFEGIRFTSFSQSWNEEMLEELYLELLENFHSYEIKLLRDIELYDNSPYGANGCYFEDVSVINGEFIQGSNAKIQLYNCGRYNTIDLISYNLSHEYGHHYMLSNILSSEGIYRSNMKESEYAKLRKLRNYPVYYGEWADENYSYLWDADEIAANDYVQLLGSQRARASFDYGEGEPPLEFCFNLKPQKNCMIPLAADVEGLYECLLNIGGYTYEQSRLDKKPEITHIDNSGLEFTPAQGEGPFEYTVIMYPRGSESMPQAIKTISGEEALSADFDLMGMECEMVFKVYTRDKRGFIFSSEDFLYTPDYSNENTTLEETEATTENISVVEGTSEETTIEASDRASGVVYCIYPDKEGTLWEAILRGAFIIEETRR